MDTITNSINEMEQILTCDGETVDEDAIITTVRKIGNVVISLLHMVLNASKRMNDIEDKIKELTEK